MREFDQQVFNALDGSPTQTSGAIDGSSIMQISAQAVNTGTVQGTVKFQASNDHTLLGQAPTNWNDVSSSTITLTTAGAYLGSVLTICYNWLRVVWTPTTVGTQTVTLIADTGVAQVQTVTAVADSSGSLNSTWFSLSSVNATTKAQKNFYVWFDNGGGVDPAPAGKTGIHVTYSNNATATTIGGLMATAIAALTNDFASAVNTAGAVVITNLKPGLVPAAADGTAATGFTFSAPSTPGVNSNLNNTYFLLNDAGNTIKYYVWYNIASLGTDPLVAGRTAIAVTGAASASANTLGGSSATAIAAANSGNDFTASNNSGVVTITNKVIGQFTPAVDGAVPTGFTFATTSDVGNISVTVKTNGQ